MASLMELVERINRGELIEPSLLEMYQTSANSAEKFLSNHARAMLELRRSHGYLTEALEAIDFSDQKVLFQYLAVLGFLGLSDRRAEPVIRFGAAAIARREVALGLEAIQSGIAQDLTCASPWVFDRASADFVAEQHDAAADALGWSAPAPSDWTNEQLKIGYLVSALADDDAVARTTLGLARNLDAKQTRLHVYSTEAGVRRERQSFTQGPFAVGSAKRGRETLDTLSRRRVPSWVAPLDQDLATGCRELATKIHTDAIDVLIIDAAIGDGMAAVVASLGCAKAKIDLVRRHPLLGGEIDSAIFFDAKVQTLESATMLKRSTPTSFIQEGIELSPADTAPGNRQAMGIPDQSVVYTTQFAEFEQPSAEFMDVVILAMRQQPNSVLLVTGEADTGVIKRRLESAGLGKRLGCAARRKDAQEMLRISDIHLNPFPRQSSNVSGMLSAMAGGKAVVALAGPTDDPQRAQAVIGDEYSAGTTTAYVELVARLSRDPATRTAVGAANKTRAAEHFSYANTAREIESRCRELLNARPTHNNKMAA